MKTLLTHDVKLNDANNPCKITRPFEHPEFGVVTYNVSQEFLLGWIKDGYK
ncbi:hypothetical protein GW796_00905 [archaeon]|nr:hypothetical protein [archaeon]